MISENISLLPYNTFGVQANARYFTQFNSVEMLRQIMATSEYQSTSHLILGGGSNLLFTKDFDGLVLKNEIKGISLLSEDDTHYYVQASAGEVWHSFVLHCIKHNYAGVENLSLIPGCVGASPMQNIGAYGVEIKDVFHSLEAIHQQTGEIQTFSNEACAFGYRESIFKREEKNNWIIISVTFRLLKRPILQTSYGAIEEELDKMNLDTITIRDVSNAIINIRSSKLPNPKEIGNAGSFFKNPVVSLETYHEIKKHYNNAPCYPINEHEVKIPAGWLIETAGWKGKKIDSYGVHDRQALVLVNYGNARGKEIFDLSTTIIQDIQNKFNIELEREVNII